EARYFRLSGRDPGPTLKSEGLFRLTHVDGNDPLLIPQIQVLAGQGGRREYLRLEQLHLGTHLPRCGTGGGESEDSLDIEQQDLPVGKDEIGQGKPRLSPRDLAGLGMDRGQEERVIAGGAVEIVA